MRPNRANSLSPFENLESLTTESRHSQCGNIRYRIAKFIDVSDFAFDRLAMQLRFRPIQSNEIRHRPTKLRHRYTTRQMRGNRREHISPVKRLAHWLQKISLILQR